MFHFKKIIAPFLFPVPLCIEILLVGLALLWFTRRQRLGKILVTLAFVLLTALSYDFFSGYLLTSLEYKYHPLVHPPAKVKWVVVLGSSAYCDVELPIGNRINEAGLFRLIEAVRLYREIPGCKLLLSGGGTGRASSADNMAEIALMLGLPNEDLVVESDSVDTETEARIIRPIVQDEQFVLVTSASHMERSMALFKKEGMHPVPAPAEYLVQKDKCNSPYPEMPSIEGLKKATTAFYEYLGLTWLKIRGGI